ncbi:MAG: hypothetical protein SFV81_05125 [Pirellulaceae bacterium]|nr:hypothetical protein [Pirellulaceae bacterium]
MSTGSPKTSVSKPVSSPARPMGQLAQECCDVREDFQTLVADVGTSVHTYCRKRPQMAGLMIFALGFYVGWKVKPW